MATPDYRQIITLEPGKLNGRACIRGMRVTVGDVLGWLASGMSEAEIVDEFPELTAADINAALAYAAERENGPKQTLQRSTLAQKWAGKFQLPEPDESDPRLTHLVEKYLQHRS